MVVRCTRAIAVLAFALAAAPGCTCITLPEGAVFHCDSQADCSGDQLCVDGWCAPVDGGSGGGVGGSGGGAGGSGGGAGGSGGGGAAEQLIFMPTDDAFIEQELPDQNNNGDPRLQIDLTPVRQESVIKFTVSGVGGRSIKSAVLRLYCINGSSTGGELHLASSNNWDEGTVTWNTAPAATTLVGSLPLVDLDLSYELDVRSAITGDGTFSFRMVPASDDGADYHTKEAANPPLLILTVQ